MYQGLFLKSKIIKNKLRIHNYTQINDESEEVNTNQIPYKYEDGDNDVIPNISDKNDKDEIDENFDDELDNKFNYFKYVPIILSINNFRCNYT